MPIMLAIGGAAVGSALTYMALQQATEEDSSAENRSGPSSSAFPPLPEGQISSGALHTSSVEKEGLLTGILAQLWGHINVAGCQIIREAVEPSLKESLPAPLNTMHFTKLDLGKTPLRLDNIVVHGKTSDDVVQFDMDVVWDGGCEIELKADYVGKLGVKKIKFRGRLAVILKPLTNIIPIAAAAQYFFIDPPTLSLDFTGLANIADFSVVDKTIRKIIDDTMAEMVVLPNRMMTKLDLSKTIFDIYHPPLGVARISVIRGTGFQEEKHSLRAHDVPDVFCELSLGASAVFKTSVVKNSLSPQWTDETADFLLFDYGQTLKIHAWDEDTGKLDSNDDLGIAKVTIQRLLLASGDRVVTLPLEGGNGANISIRCDLMPLTSTSMTSLTNQSAKDKDLGGVVTILVSQAFDVPQETSSFVKVTYGDKNFSTATVVPGAEGVDATKPVFDAVYHVPLLTHDFLKSRHDIVLELMKPGEKEAVVLGTTTISHAELSRAENMTVQEKRSLEGSGCTLECRASIQGILLEGAKFVGGPAESTSRVMDSTENTPGLVDDKPQKRMGTVQITAVKGRGFKDEVRRFKKNDVPDIYLRITVGTVNQPWKTKTIDNCREPVWNETNAFLMEGHHDKIIVEAFDHDGGKMDKDDDLGSAEVTVGKILLAGGIVDVELKNSKGEALGAFITLRCENSG